MIQYGLTRTHTYTRGYTMDTGMDGLVVARGSVGSAGRRCPPPSGGQGVTTGNARGYTCRRCSGQQVSMGDRVVRIVLNYFFQYSYFNILLMLAMTLVSAVQAPRQGPPEVGIHRIPL